MEFGVFECPPGSSAWGVAIVTSFSAYIEMLSNNDLVNTCPERRQVSPGVLAGESPKSTQPISTGPPVYKVATTFLFLALISEQDTVLWEQHTVRVPSTK